MISPLVLIYLILAIANKGVRYCNHEISDIASIDITRETEGMLNAIFEIIDFERNDSSVVRLDSLLETYLDCVTNYLYSVVDLREYESTARTQKLSSSYLNCFKLSFCKKCSEHNSMDIFSHVTHVLQSIPSPDGLSNEEIGFYDCLKYIYEAIGDKIIVCNDVIELLYPLKSHQVCVGLLESLEDILDFLK